MNVLGFVVWRVHHQPQCLQYKKKSWDEGLGCLGQPLQPRWTHLWVHHVKLILFFQQLVKPTKFHFKSDKSWHDCWRVVPPPTRPPPTAVRRQGSCRVVSLWVSPAQPWCRGHCTLSCPGRGRASSNSEPVETGNPPRKSWSTHSSCSPPTWNIRCDQTRLDLISLIMNQNTAKRRHYTQQVLHKSFLCSLHSMYCIFFVYTACFSMFYVDIVTTYNSLCLYLIL